MAGPLCRWLLHKGPVFRFCPGEHDLLEREGSMPDGDDALAARFTRAWSANAGAPTIALYLRPCRERSRNFLRPPRGLPRQARRERPGLYGQGRHSLVVDDFQQDQKTARDGRKPESKSPRPHGWCRHSSPTLSTGTSPPKGCSGKAHSNICQSENRKASSSFRWHDVPTMLGVKSLALSRQIVS